MKTYFALLLSACVSFSSCNLFSNYGKKVEIGESEVYYKGDGVTEKDAQSIGDYLKEIGYFKGTAKSVQLTHDGEDYILHVVVDKSKITDASRLYWWKMQSAISMELFKGKSLRIALADEKLKDLEVLNPAAVYQIGESLILYDNSEIRKTEVKALADFLSEDAKLFTETNAAVGFYTKEDDVPLVRIFVNPKTFKKSMLPAFSFWQEQMREKVFNGEKAKLLLISPDDLEQVASLPKLTEEERQAFLNPTNTYNNDQDTNYTVDSTVTQTTSGVERLPNN